MLLQNVRVSSFLWLHSIPLYKCTTAFLCRKRKPSATWIRNSPNGRTFSLMIHVTKVYLQNIQKLNVRKTNNSIKKWTKHLNRDFSKKNIQRACRHMKKCSTPLIIREMQIKPSVRYYLTLSRMAIISKLINNKCWQGCREKGTLAHCWWDNAAWCNHCGKQYGESFKYYKWNSLLTQWFHFWEYTPRIPKHQCKKNMHPHVYSSTIYNSQNLEKA